MRVSFFAPSADFPTGGAIAVYEFANGLARRGHEVHLVHLDVWNRRIRDLDQITWCDLDERLQHHLPEDPARPDVPTSDVVVCFDNRIPSERGHIVMLVQAYRILPGEVEEAIYRVSYPKVCTSRFLRERVIAAGTPPASAVHVAYGLRHDKYRVSVPLDERPPRVAMLYNNHPTKRAAEGVAALERAREQVADLEVVLFGPMPPAHPIPAGMEFVTAPTQEALVHRIYNTSRIFLSSAEHEGFGLAAIEAMACGCALVTTDNGGSRDYALHGETAMVASECDASMLAEHVVALLRDEEQRVELALRGAELVGRFSWDRAAQRLERFLFDYKANPERFLASGTPA